MKSEGWKAHRGRDMCSTHKPSEWAVGRVKALDDTGCSAKPMYLCMDLVALALDAAVKEAQQRQRGAYTEAMRQLVAIQPSGTKSGTNEDYIRIGYETALHKVSALIANAPLAGMGEKP